METIISGSVTPDATVCSSLGIGSVCNSYCECEGGYYEPVCPNQQCLLNFPGW